LFFILTSSDDVYAGVANRGESGYAEAGYGKMMFKEGGALNDFKGYLL
jgi:hypothetical protein